jgi:hypothetical protein
VQPVAGAGADGQNEPVRAQQNRVATLRAALTGGRAPAVAAGAAVAVALGLGVAAVTLGAPSGPGERAGPGGSDADAAMLVPPDLGSAEAAPAEPVDLGGPTEVAGADHPATPEVTGDGAVPVEPAAPVVLAAGPDPGTSVTTTSTTRPSSTTTTTPPDGSGGLLDAIARLLGGA